MTSRLAFGAMIAMPLAVAACAREPEPVAMTEPMPMMSGAEQACAARGAEMTGMEAGSMTVTPLTSTKTGATVYSVGSGMTSYNCVVEVDGTISSFTQA